MKKAPSPELEQGAGLRSTTARPVRAHWLPRSAPAIVIAGLLASWITAPVPVSGQECIDYADYLHFVGYVDTPGQPIEVVVAGDRAFLADGAAGVQILDLSNPAAPAIIGNIDSPARSVAVSGAYLYIGSGAYLCVADISNLASPVIVGQVAVSGFATHVTVAGDRAYVATEFCWSGCVGSLEIVDVSNPTSPVIVGHFDPMPFLVHDVEVMGPYALLATGWSEQKASYGLLQILDVSNSASPVVVGSVGTERECSAVAVAGGYAYAASTKLQVIDLSNPASPTIVGDVYTRPASGVAVDGNHAYVTDTYLGLQVVDVSNPASPAIVGTVGTTGIDVALAGDYAYVPNPGYPDNLGLKVVDISNPDSPAIVGSANTSAADVAVTSTYAFLAAGTAGLQVVDVSNPALPTVVGSLDVPNRAREVAVAGHYAYLTDDGYPSDGSLLVIDISDPAAPAVVSSVPTDHRGWAVAAAGSYAYVASTEFFSLGTLQIVDISNPASPVITGSVHMPHAAFDVAVAGDYAYVAGHYGFPLGGNLQIIDISNRSAPAIVGTVHTPSAANGVAISGNYVYIATESSGLQVVDVSNPASPITVGSVNLLFRPQRLAIDGTYAYVADLYLGVQVVDISNPAIPVIVGNGDTPGAAWAVAVLGNLVYIADDSGLQILPIQCPVLSPVEISSFEAIPVPQGILIGWVTSEEIDHLGFHVHRSMSAEGDYARVTSEMIQPPGPYRFLDTDVKPGISYFYRLEAVDRSGGQEFYGPLMATAAEAGPAPVALRNQLAQSHPNPFHPAIGGTAISFELAHRTRARLQVFDAAGRHVRLILDEAQEPGQHTAFWDGRNDRGEAVSSGVYFYRLDAGDFSDTRSLVQLR